MIMLRSAKPSGQSGDMAKKARSTLGIIKRTTVSRDKDTIQVVQITDEVTVGILHQDMESIF